MDAREVFLELGEDYDEVLGRLVTDERITKYLKKFADGGSIADIHGFLADENYEEAFRLVHTAKGMAMNMGLSKLTAVTSDLCEELRGGKPNKPIDDMIKAVEEEFEKTKAIIGQMN